jgi:hypothetical protein
MSKIFLAVTFMFLGGCNAAFNEAVKRQMADGYKWVAIPCRPVNPDLPAVTFDTLKGLKLVCNVLRK